MNGRKGLLNACAWIALIATLLVGSPLTAGELKTEVSFDRAQLVSGEDVRLTIAVHGEGTPDEYIVEQPQLGEMKLLELRGVEQRNEVTVGSAKELFTLTFIYTLRAKGAGEESLSPLQVKYKKQGDAGSRTLQTEGAKVVVASRGPAIPPRVFLAVLAGLGIAILMVFRRLRAGRRKEMAARVSPVGDTRADAASAALSAVEEANALRLEGDFGAYGAKISAALSAYAGKEPSAEIAGELDRLRLLCERVRYAADRDAENGIESIARKAELFFKKKIREEAR